VSFGETFRELRLRAGLKQTELAERAGVSDRTISKLEHGTACSAATARKLATALGLAGTAHSRFVAAATGRDGGQEVPLAVPAATRTLPHDVGTFTGRETELRQLREFTDADDSSGTPLICVVHGMAGVGKSALAVHFAHEVADRFPDGQLYVRLHGHEVNGRPVEPVDVLSALLLAVDILPGAIPDGLEERAALWRSELAKRRVLLLLDDASGSKQIRPLLPGSGGTLVLVTSRQRLAELPEAADVPLETMSSGDAADLFVRIARRPSPQADSPAVAQVVASCGFLPLTITVAAGYLRQHHVWAVTDLAEALARNDGGLGRITADRVCDAFDLSYRNLAPGLRRFFRCLGLYPGSDIDSYAAAALAGVDLGTAQTLLDQLFDYHLIEEPAARGRYRFHDLIREHARAVAAEDPVTERLAAQQRLLAYYLQMARAADRQLARRTPSGLRDIAAEPPADAPQLHDPQDALVWMDADYLNLHAAADYAAASGLPEYAIAIPVAMVSYLYRRGHWRQGLDLSRLAQGAAGELGDDLSAARILTDIGWLQYMLADMRAARASLTEALALHGGLADPVGEGHALSHLGAADHSTGDYDAAARNWLAARTLYQRAGDVRGEAEVTHRLGVVQMSIGEYPAAIASQEAALAAYGALGDTIGQANVLAYLGHLHGAQGRYDDGIAEITRAEELFRDAEDQWNVAGCLYYRGAVEVAAGHIEWAAADLSRALEMYADADDEWDEAGVRNEMGMLQTATGQYADAAANLARAAEIYDRHETENGLALVNNSRGELALVVDDPAAALAYHSTALEIAVRCRMKDEEARACAGVGRSRLRAGERHSAIGPLRRALELYEFLGSPHAERVRLLLGQEEPADKTESRVRST
jgi:transcriptional regulator with XRE-family HTH domain/tetratricopeptide (TPR) repeat protein